MSTVTKAPAVLVLCPMPPALQQRIESSFRVYRAWEFDHPGVVASECCQDIQAVVTSGALGVGDELLLALPQLRLIASFGVGTDKINLSLAARRGIKVSNTPGVLDNCVADTAFALLIDLARGISAADRFVRRGAWLEQGFPLQTSLRGKVCGIAGMGNIGRGIAARASAFGMQVAYCGRRRQADVTYAYYPSVESLAQAADFLVLAVPGGEETRDLVDAKVLAALGCKGFLINISRGSVVDEGALIDALRNATIAGAGLDVFALEPKVPEALLRLETVVLTPHLASATHETRAAMADLVWKNLNGFFCSGTLLTAV